MIDREKDGSCLNTNTVINGELMRVNMKQKDDEWNTKSKQCDQYDLTV